MNRLDDGPNPWTNPQSYVPEPREPRDTAKRDRIVCAIVAVMIVAGIMVAALRDAHTSPLPQDLAIDDAPYASGPATPGGVARPKNGPGWGGVKGPKLRSNKPV